MNLSVNLSAHQRSLRRRDAVDSRGQTCLHVASSRHHVEVGKYLFGLKKELVDVVDNYGGTCLDVALREGHLNVVSYLADRDWENGV